MPASAQQSIGSTPGSFNFGIASRSFDAPLFGNSSVSTFHIFAHQVLRNGIDLSLNGTGGFPTSAPYISLEADRVSLWDGVATFDAGDFAASRLQPEGVLLPFSDTMPLVGAQMRWQRDRRAFAVFTGESKFLVALPTRSRRPLLAGVEYFEQHGHDAIDAGITLIERPLYFDPSIDRDADALLRLSYLHQFSPSASAFADGYIGRGDGFRAGGSFNGQLGQATLAAYDFSRQFPVISSFNPGERGLQAAGSYRPSELSTISAQFDYVASDMIDRRHELRGYTTYVKSFGSGAPYLFVSYARQQLMVDVFDQNVSRIGDRVTVALGQATQSDFTNVQIDHVVNHGAFPDTTQLLALRRSVVGTMSYLDSTLLVQREPGRLGATLDSAIESPWRTPYYVLYGFGVAYLSTSARSGEGLVRLGITRRPLLNGMSGRLEVRIPVPIGLTRSHLHQRLVMLDVGATFGWRDVSAMQSIVAPLITPNQFGGVSGRIMYGGKGLGDVPVFLNGQEAAHTNAAGEFRIGQVRVGPVNVSIDPGQLESGFGVVGDAAREVIVEPRQFTRVDFQVARFTTFRGSLVRCEGDRRRPLAGAKLALVRGDVAIPLDVSASGSFQSDNIPPAEYDLVIDPTSISGVPARDLPRLRVDLRTDLLGFVIGIGCPQTIIAAGQRPSAAPLSMPSVAELQPPPSPQPATPPVMTPPQLVPAPVPAPVPLQPRTAVPPAAIPTPSREEELRRASQLVHDEVFREALAIFERLQPIVEATYRFDYAVALYETGHYADAKRELATSTVPDTDEARRYVAKIEGAISP